MKKLHYKVLILIILLIFMSCRKNDIEATPTPEIPLVHPLFSLTYDDLSALLNYQIEDVRNNIMNNPVGFLDLAVQMLKEDQDLYLIVDKQTSLPSDFIPDDLIDLDDIGLLNKNREGHRLRRIALPSLIEMTKAASEEDLNLVCSSAYRSYVYQVKTFNYWVKQLGREEAERISAQPGKSQHQLGVTMDFGSIDESYESTPEGTWQLNNAWKYGWSLSYPKGYEQLTGYSYENWHYRYIGKPATHMEKEYFSGIQYNLLDFWQKVETRLRAAYTGE